MTNLDYHNAGFGELFDSVKPKGGDANCRVLNAEIQSGTTKNANHAKTPKVTDTFQQTPTGNAAPTVQSAGAADFDGVTYDPMFDATRLRGEMRYVYNMMKDGKWRTLNELLCPHLKYSEAGISARLRDLRKKRFGSHTVERRRRGDKARGLFEYRLL